MTRSATPYPGSHYMHSGGAATLVFHCVVFGVWGQKIRDWGVTPVKPYAQYEHSVTIVFREPRQRNKRYVRVTPDNVRYHTIEADGQVLYDSRDDVPCDMEKWYESYTRNEERRPGRTIFEVKRKDDQPEGGAST